MQPSFRLDDLTAAGATAQARAALPDLPRRLQGILSLDDFEREASRLLPRPLFAYVSGGCETDRARADNLAAFSRYTWVPRVLNDTSARTLATELLGARHAAPFGIAPMGICALTGFRADLAQARAAAAANIPAVLSGASLIPMEEVARANPDAWFQAYVPGEVDRIDKLLERVARSGFRTLVLTVDVPVNGNRENNLRAGFSTPLQPSLGLAWQGITHPRWLFGTALRTLARHGMPHFENTQATRGSPILARNVTRDLGQRDRLSWEHVARIRDRWKGKLVLKGVLHPADAVRARDSGIDGVILSNHGGRQLDAATSPLRMLAGTRAAVGPGYPLMIDSGFRRGNDVLLALALGADFVFLGRPFNYAGAIAGEAGIRHAITILASEMLRNMALLGIARLDELGMDHVMTRETA